MYEMKLNPAKRRWRWANHEKMYPTPLIMHAVLLSMKIHDFYVLYCCCNAILCTKPCKPKYLITITATNNWEAIAFLPYFEV
jgi:hypothetical protein